MLPGTGDGCTQAGRPEGLLLMKPANPKVPHAHPS